MVRRLPSQFVPPAPDGGAKTTERARFEPATQWVKLYQRTFLQVVDKNYDGRKMTLRLLRVYLVLICHMDRRNYVRKCQKDLASIIDMTDQAFSTAIGKLEELGYLVRLGGRDRSRKIMLQPFFVSIGRDDEGRDVCGEFSRLEKELGGKRRSKDGGQRPARQKIKAMGEGSQPLSQLAIE